ncbi:MAG TPA: tetratricopeptide repeat protein, partial [Candidatus Binatus sp.]|nr:tetratricopeptide repeat protein [Candidatus Binatus sp.]
MPSLRHTLLRAWTGKSLNSSAPTAAVEASKTTEGAGPRAAIDAAIAEGAALFSEARFAEALAVTDRALEKSPRYPDLLFARGSVLFGWGRHVEAYESYRRAAGAGLDHPDLDMQLGWSCVSVGRLDDAEVHFRKGVAAAPDSLTAYVALVNVLEMRGTLASCASEMASGLSRWPDDYDAMNFLGGCKLHQADREGAIEAFRRATVIDPARPRAWINLGTALDWATSLPEALAAFERAYELEAADGITGDSFVNLAVALREQGRRAEAVDLLRRSLARNPDVKGHVLYSMILLEMGWFEEGWLQHEFRWLKEPLRSIRWTIRRPQWSGQDLQGKTIVLHAEQGFGDAIQFIRYAPMLKSMGARVLFDPFRGFDAISTSFDGLDEVLRDGNMPDFDFHLPLLSLPRVFGADATSIPSRIPYLRTQPTYLDKWLPRIVAPGKVKVGIVWAGNPKHPRDYQRSVPVSMLASLRSVEGVQFYSLQKGPISLASPLDVVDLGPELDDYCDTAAIVSMLDLVISVDTSVAHLAGALGKLVWLMVPTPPDWRWLLEGERTAWYPTMLLFRQKER